MSRASILIAICVATSGCGILGISGDKRTLEVAPYKAHCFGLFETLCLQVRETGASEFTNMFQTPRGFEYQWGHQYVIRVRDRKIDNPPADGSSNEVILESVLSKTAVAVGTRFQLVVVTNPGLEPAGPARWLLFGGPESLACPAGAPCDDLQSLIDSAERIEFTLEFPPVPGDPFVVLAWAACPEPFGPCAAV